MRSTPAKSASQAGGHLSLEKKDYFFWSRKRRLRGFKSYGKKKQRLRAKCKADLCSADDRRRRVWKTPLLWTTAWKDQAISRGMGWGRSATPSRAGLRTLADAQSEVIADFSAINKIAYIQAKVNSWNVSYDKIQQNKQREMITLNYNDKIRALREDNEQNQKTIAEILGTSQSYYSEYELGKRQLPIHHLKTLCIHYGVSADYILGLPKGLKWPR